MTAACLLAAATLRASRSDRARALHARSLVFDGHVHAVDREFYHGGDIGERKSDGQFDLPRANEGGLGALFFSIFVTEDYYPAPPRNQAGAAHARLRHRADRAQRTPPSRSPATPPTSTASTRAGKIAAVLDIEGSFDLDGDLGRPPRHVPPRPALRPTLRAQLDQQLRRLLLLHAEMARPQRPRPRLHPRNESPRHGDQRFARLRRSHLAGHRRLAPIPSSPPITASAPSTTSRATCRKRSCASSRPRAASSAFSSATSSTTARPSTGPAHAGKPFWDTSAIAARGPLPIAEIDKLVAPQFPMLPADHPARHPHDRRRLGRRGRPRHRHRRRGPRLARQRLRWRPAPAPPACATSATSR